jgi:hypothetical protein
MAVTWPMPPESCSHDGSTDNPQKSLFNDISAHYLDFSFFFIAVSRFYGPKLSYS